MSTRQVSIFLENERGRLAEVTHLLHEEGINIRALCLADTTRFGVLRLIVSDPDRCLSILREREFAAQVTEVVAVEVEDHPGGLDRILQVLGRAGINIEYMYAFVEKSGDNAIVVFKVDDAARAVQSLMENGIGVVPDEVIRNL